MKAEHKYLLEYVRDYIKDNHAECCRSHAGFCSLIRFLIDKGMLPRDNVTSILFAEMVYLLYYASPGEFYFRPRKGQVDNHLLWDGYKWIIREEAITYYLENYESLKKIDEERDLRFNNYLKGKGIID